jgi:hypothetical protein
MLLCKRGRWTGGVVAFGAVLKKKLQARLPKIANDFPSLNAVIEELNVVSVHHIQVRSVACAKNAIKVKRMQKEFL